MNDTRQLHARVRRYASMAAARAIGFDKMAQKSAQDADNAREEAATLNEAADLLEALK